MNLETDSAGPSRRRIINTTFAQEARNLHAVERELKVKLHHRLAIERAAEWIRAGAPGRALEVLENALDNFPR